MYINKLKQEIFIRKKKKKRTKRIDTQTHYCFP